MAGILWTIICVSAMICATVLFVKGPDIEIEFYDHSKDQDRGE